MTSYGDDVLKWVIDIKIYKHARKILLFKAYHVTAT